MNQTEKMRKALRKVVELIQYQYTGSMKAMSALQDAANAAEEALAAEPAEEAQPQHFICPTGYAEGMTLRDYFAAKAMQSLLVKETWVQSGPDMFARDAYTIADAMLKEREV